MTITPVGEPVGEHRVVVTVRAGELAPFATVLLARGYRIALVAGHDDGDALRVVYLFTQAGTDRRVELHLPCDPADPHVPSLAGLSFPAGRFEREIRDLFGIVPDDHPMPGRLVRHFHWPRGWHPMRRNAGDPPPFGEDNDPYQFRTVAGPGVYEIPVGPVHAGMIEPGHFRFSVVGETVLNLKVRLWFVHRGIEKLFEGATPSDGIELAERVSGDTSVGHALAFCRAVEDAYGLTIRPATQQIRAILLELERLYNHINDIGGLCNDVGHSILNNQAQRIREQLLRINDQVTGHRLLRGAIQIGGATIFALPDPDALAAIAADAAEIVTLALAHTVVRERFTGTAVLTRQQAIDLGTLGYVARASGVLVDARHDHPVHGISYPHPTHSHTDGDVLSRFLIRAEEITASVQTITTLMQDFDQASPPDAPALQSVARRASSGVGIVEGWRGSIVHRVELTDGGILTRVRIIDPSFFN
ncbi:MAG: NADH-quinone oxidoreductase subunit C, partial [Nakamurella sp.]